MSKKLPDPTISISKNRNHTRVYYPNYEYGYDRNHYEKLGKAETFSGNTNHNLTAN